MVEPAFSQPETDAPADNGLEALIQLLFEGERT
ncbi:hypothetical protein FHT76_008149 [Rhizobium sp. BK176]|nr:hypothetical protein [Rhizobium sp. BK176]